MKKIFFGLFIIFFILGLVFWFKNSPQRIISILDTKHKKITSQSTLHYEINFLGFLPVGEAYFWPPKETEFNGEHVCYLSAESRTSALISPFFSASAKVESFTDIKTRNPLLFRQRLVMKNKPGSLKEVTYNQKQGVMVLSGVSRQILPDTQDPLSAFFNLRRLDFYKEKDFEMSLNTNQKNYVLKGTVQLREAVVNNKKNKIAIINADIHRRDKNPYHKSEITMIILPEKENIPILIRVFASGVLITARLLDTE